MVNALLSGILGFVADLVSFILTPIDLLINSSMPVYGDVLSLVQQFFDMILSFFPWILSWFNFPLSVLTFVSLYYIAKLTISAALHGVKLALAWWRTVKP